MMKPCTRRESATEIYSDAALCMDCPEWTQVSMFYNYVNTPTRMMIDASAYGTLLDKPPREGLEILEKLSQNDYQHPTTRRGNMRMWAEMRMQNQEVALKSLENQAGQISQVLKLRPIGGFPSDNEVVKGASHEQCKAISTRSSNVLEPPTKNKQGETTVANSKATSDTDVPVLAYISSSIGKDHDIPTKLGEAKITSEASQPKQPRKDTPKEPRPPPFPQRQKKQK
ncbi:hypothetical protein V6N11_084291 [Hibiscus sabdariffa]|uniref:Uncharacterized protein n=1 Tax=Hibiscus sabdariffa TaxID=183260 RepID=A0ABR2QSL1_9ROSI